MNVKAVVFDLDDTLYSERDYVSSGFAAVAEVIEREHGLSGIAAEMSDLFDADKKDVYTRVLKNHGIEPDKDTIARLVRIYRDHSPVIKPSRGVVETLKRLKETGYKIGIITDGDPDRQRAKITALGIQDLIDKIIVTDELGGEIFRKPSPKAFELMCAALKVEPSEMLYVGDNPLKDFAIKKFLPVNTVMLNNNGLYAQASFMENIMPDQTVNEIDEITEIVKNNDATSSVAVDDASERLRKFVHENLLELIKFIDSVCKKENISYSLAGGTMLGAVRHKGFIPWDDDADIVLHRSEFVRLKSIIGGYLENTPFVWERNGRVEGITYRQTPVCDGQKVEHIVLDIFVLDNVPDDDNAYKKQIFRLKKLQGMMKKGKLDWKRYSLKGKILVLATKFLGAFHSQSSLLKKYEAISVRYNNVDTKRRFISNDIFSVFDIPYDKELVSSTVDVPFETEMFPVFEHYDELLTAMYGDYMTPPPLEERVFLHTSHCDD